jgi:hypothetical protein
VGSKKEFQEFLTARSRGSLDQEDKSMDEERTLLFRPGDAPRPETALPPGGGSQKLRFTRGSGRLCRPDQYRSGLHVLILPILFIK